jgi:hypothetical protein
MLTDDNTNFEAIPVRASLIPSLQKPVQQVLWIGCSDSCFEETKILDLLPDEMLVHRNLGNMLIEGDMSSEVTIKHAVSTLKVFQRSYLCIILLLITCLIGQTHSGVWPLRMRYCASGGTAGFEWSLVRVFSPI